MTVTVGLDTSPLAQLATGTEEVLEGLVGGLDAVGQPMKFLAHAPGRLNPRAPGLGLAPHDRPSRAAKWRWETFGLARAAAASRVDLVHIPFLAHPPRPLAVPTVVTVHDLIPYLYPGYQRQWTTRMYFAGLRRRLAHAHRLVAVSDATWHDLDLVFPAWHSRVTVIPNGVHPAYFAPRRPEAEAAVIEALGIRPGPVLLYAAGYQPHKNVALLVRAAGEAARQVPDLQLVLVGALGRLDGLAPHVVATPRLAREQLAALYHVATAVCCPSHYEGFGLSAAQGMATGTPVLASDIPAHREVLQDAGLLLSDQDAGAWAAAITRVIEDAPRQQALAEAGKVRAAQYRWETIATQYQELYQRVVGA